MRRAALGGACEGDSSAGAQQGNNPYLSSQHGGGGDAASAVSAKREATASRQLGRPLLVVAAVAAVGLGGERSKVDSPSFAVAFHSSDALEVVADDGAGTRCLGVQVGGLVATAAHCIGNEMRLVWQGETIPARVLLVDMRDDIALLTGRSTALPARPPVIVRWKEDECRVALLRKDRGKVTETWEMVPTSATVTTSEQVETFSTGQGACVGDSGGPLLGCDGHQCVVMGLLRHGSERCTGRDNYAAWPRIARAIRRLTRER